MYEQKPWLKFYGTTPHTLAYPALTLCGALHRIAGEHPAVPALRFMGAAITHGELDARIIGTSRALAAAGMKRGDHVLVCLPNIPQAVIIFYALNRLGAVPAMIHPLSTAAEIRGFALQTSCTWAVTLDAFYPRLSEGRQQTTISHIVLCGASEMMGPVMKLGFALTEARKIAPVPPEPGIIRWKDLERQAKSAPELDRPDPLAPAELALFLFSGGTTASSKAIMLSSFNCNALALQVNALGGPILPRDAMLSILPMFHGFGLAAGIHAVLMQGGTCVLIPRFTPDGLAKLVARLMRWLRVNCSRERSRAFCKV